MDSLPSWARVGQKVVCVDHTDYDEGYRVDYPPFGVPVTISDIIPNSIGRGPHLVIQEHPNIGYFSECEIGWRLSRFRPLISKTIEDDLAIFAPLLNTKKMEELAQ